MNDGGRQGKVLDEQIECVRSTKPRRPNRLTANGGETSALLKDSVAKDHALLGLIEAVDRITRSMTGTEGRRSAKTYTLFVRI